MFKYLLLKTIYEISDVDVVGCSLYDMSFKYFLNKERAKERYMIEAKNSELKHRHGYDVAIASGLVCMQMQGALTIFAVNIKRILKLISMKA